MVHAVVRLTCAERLRVGAVAAGTRTDVRAVALTAVAAGVLARRKLVV